MMDFTLNPVKITSDHFLTESCIFRILAVVVTYVFAPDVASNYAPHFSISHRQKVNTERYTNKY